MKVDIRWLIRPDFEQALKIQGMEDWSEAKFKKELKKRHVIPLVAEYDERIVGFLVYQLHKYELEILNMGVSVSRQRIGTQLIDFMTKKLLVDRREQLIIAVKDTLLPVHLFLQKNGFRAIAVTDDKYHFMKDIILCSKPFTVR